MRAPQHVQLAERVLRNEMLPADRKSCSMMSAYQRRGPMRALSMEP